MEVVSESILQPLHISAKVELLMISFISCFDHLILFEGQENFFYLLENVFFHTVQCPEI